MEQTTTKTQTFELVKGEFSADEAKEILLNLIHQKIKFHNLRDWSCQEKCGKPDAHSVKRIEELKESRDSILAMMKSAEEEGLSLKVNAQISIELI